MLDYSYLNASRAIYEHEPVPYYRKLLKGLGLFVRDSLLFLVVAFIMGITFAGIF